MLTRYARRRTTLMAVAFVMIILSAAYADEEVWKHPDECTPTDQHFWEGEWRDCTLLVVMQTYCTYVCDGIPAGCYKYLGQH